MQAHLAGFRGILQTDGYAADKEPVKRREASTPIALSFCWAHLRRGFHKIAVGGNAPLVEDALRQIAALYKLKSISADKAPSQWMRLQRVMMFLRRCLKSRLIRAAYNAKGAPRLLAKLKVQDRPRFEKLWAQFRKLRVPDLVTLGREVDKVIKAEAGSEEEHGTE